MPLAHHQHHPRGSCFDLATPKGLNSLPHFGQVFVGIGTLNDPHGIETPGVKGPAVHERCRVDHRGRGEVDAAVSDATNSAGVTASEAGCARTNRSLSGATIDCSFPM